MAAGVVGGGLLLTDRDDSRTAASGGADASAPLLAEVPASSSGRDYAAAGALEGALPALLAAPVTGSSTSGSGSGAGPGSAEADGDPLARLRAPDELAACLDELVAGTPQVQPVAVDYASYGGKPALVVVLSGQDAPDKVDVFVVDAGCTAGRDGTLIFRRLPRP